MKNLIKININWKLKVWKNNFKKIKKLLLKISNFSLLKQKKKKLIIKKKKIWWSHLWQIIKGLFKKKVQKDRLSRILSTDLFHIL